MTRTLSTNRRAVILVSTMLMSMIALGACAGDERSGTVDSDAGKPSPTSQPAAPTAAAPDASGASGASAVVIAAGAKLYGTNCAMCHGSTGRGDGGIGAGLNPPPRGLVDEPWRYVKAETPELEKAAIVNLLIEGVPGSAMPKYGSMLSQDDMTALAEYVMSIRK